MSYHQQQSPLQRALYESMNMQVDSMVRNGQLPPQLASQIKQQYGTQIPYSESNLANAFGSQIPQDAIHKEAQMYILNSLQRIRSSSMVAQNIEGGGQGYIGGNYPNQPAYWGNQNQGSSISLLPGRHGSGQPNQMNQNIYNPQQYQTMPNQAPPEQNIPTETTQPMKHPEKPFTEPKLQDTNKAFTTRYTKAEVQECKDAKKCITDDGEHYHMFEFVDYVPEDTTEDMIYAFSKSNKTICGLNMWFHDISFPKMIYINAPLENTKTAIQEVSTVFKSDGWEPAYNTMREHSAKFNDVMGNLLIQEINELLAVNVISEHNALAPEIITLEDIPALYTLDPNDQDWSYLLNSDSYQSKVTDVIVKAFTRLFNAPKPVLEVPDDIPYIGKCKKVIIRENGFTETTPAKTMLDSKGNISEAYLEAFKARTVILSSRRVLYTNVAPKGFLHKLAQKNRTIFIDRPTNILEWMLYHRMKTNNYPMDLYLYSVKLNMNFRMTVGTSIEGKLTINKR